MLNGVIIGLMGIIFPHVCLILISKIFIVSNKVFVYLVHPRSKLVTVNDAAVVALVYITS